MSYADPETFTMKGMRRREGGVGRRWSREGGGVGRRRRRRRKSRSRSREKEEEGRLRTEGGGIGRRSRE